MGETLSAEGRSVVIAAILIAVLAIGLGFCLIAYRLLQQEREESYAIQALDVFHRQEREFKRLCCVDQDADGIGEFGWINELGGTICPRRRTDSSIPSPISPPFVCNEYAVPLDRSSATYAVRVTWGRIIFLPYRGNGGTDDSALDGTTFFDHHTGKVPKWSTPLDPKHNGEIIDLQEKHFVLYVIPVGRDLMTSHATRRGRFAYVVNEKGNIHYTGMDRKRYELPALPLTDYRAAFFDNGSTDTVFNNPLGDGQKGFDGNIWYKLKTDKK